MANTLKLLDFHRFQFEHQFSLPPADPLFQDTTKRFFITSINAGGGWSINYKIVDQEKPYTRTGSGSTQFYLPLCTESKITTAGITEISGFWIPA